MADHDLAKIPAESRRRIARLIESRLTTNPERFGAPLRGSLRGYWKLRAGDYRLVFKVIGSDVWILTIVRRPSPPDSAGQTTGGIDNG